MKPRNSTAPARTVRGMVRARGAPLGVAVGQKLWGEAHGDAARVQLRQVPCPLRSWAGATFSPARGLSRAAAAAEGAVLLPHPGPYRCRPRSRIVSAPPGSAVRIRYYLSARALTANSPRLERDTLGFYLCLFLYRPLLEARALDSILKQRKNKYFLREPTGIHRLLGNAAVSISMPHFKKGLKASCGSPGPKLCYSVM